MMRRMKMRMRWKLNDRPLWDRLESVPEDHPDLGLLYPIMFGSRTPMPPCVTHGLHILRLRDRNTSWKMLLFPIFGKQ